MAVLARGLSRLSPAAGTYIRFGTGGVSRRFRNSLRRRGRVQAWRRGKAFGVSLGNSLESDFNWAVIRGPGSGLQKGETPRSEKVPEGEFASESGIERNPEAALQPHGGSSQEDRKDMAAGKKRKDAVAATVESRRKRRLAHFQNSFGLRFGDWHEVRLRIRFRLWIRDRDRGRLKAGLERAGETCVSRNGRPAIPLRRIQAAESGSSSRSRA